MINKILPACVRRPSHGGPAWTVRASRKSVPIVKQHQPPSGGGTRRISRRFVTLVVSISNNEINSGLRNSSTLILMTGIPLIPRKGIILVPSAAIVGRIIPQSGVVARQGHSFATPVGCTPAFEESLDLYPSRETRLNLEPSTLLLNDWNQTTDRRYLFCTHHGHWRTLFYFTLPARSSASEIMKIKYLVMQSPLAHPHASGCDCCGRTRISIKLFTASGRHPP